MGAAYPPMPILCDQIFTTQDPPPTWAMSPHPLFGSADIGGYRRCIDAEQWRPGWGRACLCIVGALKELAAGTDKGDLELAPDRIGAKDRVVVV